MTGQVAFRLLGPFSVHHDGAPIRQTLSGSAQALLVYCLLHPGQRHRRDALLAQIWDQSEAATRAAFNTALWRVRRFLRPLPGVRLDHEGDTLRLTLTDDVTCDATDLLAHTAAAVPLSNQTRDGLCRAVALWRGPLADGLDQHWVLAARERLHSIYLAGLSALMRDAGDHEKFDLALDYGQQILTEDPFREAVHCEMLWLWVLTGQRVRAIRAHKQFCAQLRDELDIGPMAETTALFDYISTGLEIPAPLPEGVADRRPLGLYHGYLAALAKQRSQVYASLRQIALT